MKITETEIINWWKDKKNKLAKLENKAGYYRIFIKEPETKKEISYIGLSKNLKNRISQHLTEIKLLYQRSGEKRKKLLVYVLASKDLPRREAFYVKTTFFCYWKKLTFLDFNFEILSTEMPEKELDKLIKEMDYIKKFESEKMGFNGPNSKLFAFQAVMRFNNEEKIKREAFFLAEKQEKINKENRKFYLEKIEKTQEILTPWNWFTLFFNDFKKEKKAKQVWEKWLSLIQFNIYGKK